LATVADKVRLWLTGDLVAGAPVSLKERRSLSLPVQVTRDREAEESSLAKKARGVRSTRGWRSP
jgi:hypothetical protein